ncbi:MAG: DNA-directed RNA polymerase subunit omega [Candidatus Omnitrophica bacterium]|nr:DNA-directed RNA polymerase subunit omega [Candidatus Omnitrophota bacterium]
MAAARYRYKIVRAMMTREVPLEKLLDKCSNSVYKLVNLASKRAIEISEGQPKLVEVGANVKSSTVALLEIAEGKVRLSKK